MPTWLIDLKPLWLYPHYRRVWMGSTLSAIGNHLTLFAVTVQLYTLTHSSLAVGMMGLFTGIPAIIVALWGGVLGDTHDRRKIVLMTTFFQLVGCTILFIYSLLDGRNIIVLYGCVAWIFLLGSINVPMASAILPRLVHKDHLQSAIVLRVFTMHGTLFLGPLIGGFLLTKYPMAMLYFIDMCTFCAALYGILRLPPMPIPQETKSWSAVKQGIEFVKKSPIILSALCIDCILVFFCLPHALFPAINHLSFDGSNHSLGLMVAAPSLGGLVAMLVSRRLKATLSSMILISGLYALSAIGFSLSFSLTLSLLLLGIMGAFDSSMAVLRGLIVQKATPDTHRARVSSLEYIFDNCATQLSHVRAGLLAVTFTPQMAILLSSSITLLLLLTFVWFLPQNKQP